MLSLGVLFSRVDLTEEDGARIGTENRKQNRPPGGRLEAVPARAPVLMASLPWASVFPNGRPLPRRLNLPPAAASVAPAALAREASVGGGRYVEVALAREGVGRLTATEGARGGGGGGESLSGGGGGDLVPISFRHLCAQSDLSGGAREMREEASAGSTEMESGRSLGGGPSLGCTRRRDVAPPPW